MCCTRLAGNAGPKKSPKIRHLDTIAQLCRPISLQVRHISTIRKNILNNSVSATCPHNVVNFGSLAAEICWRVWGTPANFSWFRVLAALLHGTLVVIVIQTLRRWTEVPPIFDRAAITLGIGPHSSLFIICIKSLLPRRFLSLYNSLYVFVFHVCVAFLLPVLMHCSRLMSDIKDFLTYLLTYFEFHNWFFLL